MEKNQKKVLWIGMAVALFLGVVLVVSYQCGKSFNIASTQNAPQIQEKSVLPPVDSGEKSTPVVTEPVESWKTYQNKDLGLSFDYPANWGSVVVENGNRDSISLPPCEVPLPMMVNLAKKYQWGLYNAVLRFSSAPINLEIKLLDLNIPNNPSKVCNFKGDSVTISTIQPKIQNDNVLLVNKSGIKFITDPSLFNSLNTSLEGPTYTARYKNKLVWLGAVFVPYADTPEEIELRGYVNTPECRSGNAYNTDKGCGIVAWYQTGKTAEKIRTSFESLKELVQTFAISSSH